MWQSKFVVILEGLTRWNWIVLKDATSWEWLQMHFDMHVCLLEKVLLCSFDSKNFCKFCTIFGPQNGGWKMDPKMAPEFDPQKWGRKMAPKRGAQYSFGLTKIYKKSKLYLKYWVFLLGAIFGPPFWGWNSGTIFGSIFQPPFWGPKMVQNLQKFLLSKLHSKTFSSK